MSLEKVNARNLELATKIEAAISFDDDGNTVIPETFVKDNLKESVTVEVIKEVQEEEAAFGSALVLALGNTSLEAMKKDKNLNRTTAELKFGFNTLKAGLDRKQVVRNPSTGEERDKFGAAQLKLESGTSAKRGDLKRILAHVTENFAEASDKL